MNIDFRNRTIAIIGTIVLHAIVLFILYSIAITANPTQPTTDSGIFVQIGNIDEANGTFEPFMPDPQHIEETQPPTPEELQPNQVTEEQLITQDIEESIAIEEQRKKEEAEKKRKAEELRKRQEEERLLAEQREKENRVNNAMQNAFGNGNGSNGSKGMDNKNQGTAGSLQGNASSGATQGIGGWGNFNLNGRKCLDLPKPDYNSNAEGTVVVEITVDVNGNVIESSIKAGSSTNERLRRAALKAAQKAKFDISSQNVNQMGTITYYFKQR